MIKYCFNIKKMGPKKFRALYWQFGAQATVHSCNLGQRPTRVVEHYGPAPVTEIGVYQTMVEAELSVKAAKEQLAIEQNMRMAA